MASKSLVTGAAVVGQSGGPTVVINQSLVGVIEGLRPAVASGHVTKILGALNAVSGIKKDRYLELQGLAQDKLDRIAWTPSSALGSSREKPTPESCQEIFESFRKQNVHYFFYIGGNDSSDTCRIVNEMARQANYELRCFHVPKTIDNDLVRNDHTPGFGSAAKFVAQACMGDNLDNKALPGVKINVVMGRHAGFLTAASMLGRKLETDGPHLIYVPEVPMSVEQFLADVDAVFKKLGRCLIAVSEGVENANHVSIAAELAEKSGKPVERDDHGNVQLSGSGVLGDFLADIIKKELKIKRVRSDTFGYLQRSFCGVVSKVDAKEARKAGHVAAKYALKGNIDGSIAIGPVREDLSVPYKMKYKRIKLEDVAAKTRHLDPRFLVNGNNISDEFKQYALPITGELPVVEQF